MIPALLRSRIPHHHVTLVTTIVVDGLPSLVSLAMVAAAPSFLVLMVARALLGICIVSALAWWWLKRLRDEVGQIEDSAST